MIVRANSLPRRFALLDLYRFIAAVGVMLFHFRLPEDRAEQLLLGNLGLFVDFFFLLSGFIMRSNYQTILNSHQYRSFILKRINRVYPLHIITLIAAAALVPGSLSSLNGLWNVFCNLLLVHAWGTTSTLSFNSPSWSISAEMFCYLLFPWLLRLPSRMIFVLAALAFLILLWPGFPLWIQPGGLWGANFHFGALRALPSFMMGMVIYSLYERLPARRAMVLLGMAMLGVAGAGMIARLPAVAVMVAFGLGILLTAAGERAYQFRAPGHQQAIWLGDASYATYMLHGVLLAAVFAPLWTFLDGSLNHWVFMLVAVVAVTVLSRITFKRFESPVRRTLNARLVSSDLRPIRVA